MPTGHYKRSLRQGGIPARVIAYLERCASERSTTAVCAELGITSKHLSCVMRAALNSGLAVKRLDDQMSYWSLPSIGAVIINKPPRRDSVFEALDLLKQHAPISSASLAQLYGCSHDHMQVIMRKLRKRGLASPVGAGDAARWVLPSMVEAQKIAMENEYRLRRNERQRAYQLKAKLKNDEAVDDFASAPRQVIVPAHKCEPMRPRAPASVFSLASMI